MNRARGLLLAVLLAVCLGVPALAGPTGAAPTPLGGTGPSTPNADPTTRLRLRDQTSWVGPEGSFTLRLGVEGAPADAQLAVRIYGAVTGRIRFGQTIQGDGLGQPLRPLLPTLPLDTLSRASDGSVVATIPVSSTTTPPFGVRLATTGVYPVSVAVTDAAGRELDRFVTHLVRLPAAEPTGSALAVSLLVPFGATAPAHEPDGRVAIPAETAASLDATVRSLARVPGVPLTLEPTPETVQALAARDHESGSTTIATLQTALGARQVLASPYVRLDLGAWVASSANDGLAAERDMGIATTDALLGTRADTSTAHLDPTVTQDALDELSSTGTRHAVIPSDQLAPLDAANTAVTFTQSFDVTTASGPVRSVATDPDLAARLSATDDAVLNAHLALADLAVLYLDRPSQSRGVVLAFPRDRSVDPATFDALLTGLAAPAGEAGTGGRPMVAPVTTDDLFRAADPATTPARTGSSPSVLTRRYLAPPPGSLGAFPQQLAATQVRLDGYRSFVGGAEELVKPLEQLALTGGAIGLQATRQREYLEGVDASIDAETAGVAAPAQQVVTLTASRGDIPLTLENQLDHPVDVRLVFTSEKLEFPEGSDVLVTLPPASATRVEIAVETRASGAFPLEVAVRSPDDTLAVTTTKFTVRSTAISGLGLALSIGAGAFLLVWWARHFRKVRRARRLVSPDHPAARGPRHPTSLGRDQRAMADSGARPPPGD